MKKILLLLFALLSTVGIHADVLAELMFPSSNDKEVSSYTTDWTATNEYGTWAISGFNNNNNASSWTYIKCGWKSAATTATITTPVINDVITDLTITVDKTASVTKATVEVIKNGATINTVNCTNDWKSGEVVVKVSAEKGCSLKLILQNAKASANGPTVISKITVNDTHEPAGDPVAVESVSLTDDADNVLSGILEMTVSESIKLKAVVAPSDATNKNVTWTVDQDEENPVISFENGVVKALSVGMAQLTATTEDGEKEAWVTFNVSELKESTIAEFIAAEGKTCYLTGKVSDIKNTTYGNFNLTDKDGNTIYVYGCLTPAGESKQFESLGISEGEWIKVIASEYKLYNGDHEAVNVIFDQNAVQMAVSEEAGYATFVAPFEVAVPSGVTAYTVEAVDEGELILNKVRIIAANTPVVLAGTLDETIVCGKSDKEDTPVAGLLTGVYEETEAPVGSYVLQNHAAGVGFYKVGSELPTVEPNHAYLTVDSDVKVFGLAQATAIKALTAGKAEIYDMNGRQIQKLQKGINIVNGVKVLMK